ncbi:MAG: amidohydrolase [Deltaproteobacteria bacterium]|nr:MAG: amidohydrolase [Deltaproteobacteria bacterium]
MDGRERRSQSSPGEVDPALFDRLVAFRRDLHRHPELSWQEHRTAERIEAHLVDLGLQPRRLAGTAVVVDLPGESGLDPALPRVALRADTDALPVHEATGLPFASANPGVMHACGHDGHSSMLIGAAELLHRTPASLPVRLIWQPAEEKGAGAPALIEAGVLQGVGMIFGGHVDRRYPPGILVVTEGAVNASTDTFSIEIRGREGHGARPHEALDAVVVGSLLVTALQTIVSREVDPAQASVVTVGSFHAGSAPNIIAGRAVLEGTVRAQHDAVRQRLVGSLRRVVGAIGQLHGARIEFTHTPGTPALINRPEPTALARQAAIDTVGEDRVDTLHTANMGGEDFAFYLQHVPGCYIRFGARVPGREGFPAHSGEFDFHEDALATGAGWFYAVAHRAARALRDAAGTGG